MSEIVTLQAQVLLAARMLRLMQRHGLGNLDDVERLATATDALLEYEIKHDAVAP